MTQLRYPALAVAGRSATPLLDPTEQDQLLKPNCLERMTDQILVCFYLHYCWI